MVTVMVVVVVVTGDEVGTTWRPRRGRREKNRNQVDEDLLSDRS